MPVLGSYVFVFSGSPRVGKTSLVDELVKRLDCPFASFGNYVRSLADHSPGGRVVSRQILQDFGQQLVAREPLSFCAAVLRSAEPIPGRPLVVDGLRHFHLLPVLKELLPDREIRLIFVEAHADVRVARWEGPISSDELNRVDSHPVEADLGLLRQESDFIVDTTDGLAQAFESLLAWIAAEYPSVAAQLPSGNT